MFDWFTLSTVGTACILVGFLLILVQIRPLLYAKGIHKGMRMEDYQDTKTFVLFKCLSLAPASILIGTNMMWALMFLVPACSTLILAVKVATYRPRKRMTLLEEFSSILGIK